MTTNGLNLRLEALDRAVRIDLASGPESDTAIVDRAEAFLTFLNGDDKK